MLALFGSATNAANAPATTASIALPPASSAVNPARTDSSLPAETTPTSDCTSARVPSVFEICCDMAMGGWQNIRMAREPAAPPGPARARHAEIVGAGIAGLATAAALAQRGWTVTV